MVKSVYIDIEGTCAKDKATFQKVLCMYIVQKICSGCRNGTWRTCLASSLEAIADPQGNCYTISKGGQSACRLIHVYIHTVHIGFRINV